jgi:triacylglycerol esterase/lipase EstA (alpha/beta hydrolase family)
MALFVGAILATTGTATARAELQVYWMRGASSPATPPRYDKVGVIKIGSPAARNVLVLEPGTSAGAGYFVPLAQWIGSRTYTT